MRTTFLLTSPLPFFVLLFFALNTVLAEDIPIPVSKDCIDTAFSSDPFSGDSEKICLSELPTIAKRAGNVLTINLENGRKKVYKDNKKACATDDAGKCISYRLVGYESLSKHFVIIKLYYESYGAELVDARNGTVTFLRKVPYFSPDQSTFIVNDDDPESLVSCSLTMGYITQGKVKTECIYWPDDENWNSIKWLDNDRISLQAWFQIEGVAQTQDAVLSRRGQSEWVWTRAMAQPEKN